MKNETRRITEGAMMIAIIGAVSLIDRQTAGTLASNILFLFPLPLLMYSARYGFKESISVLFGMFFVLFLTSSLPMMLFLMAECVLGMIYGSGIKHKWTNRKLLLSATICGGILELAGLFTLIALFQYDIQTEVTEMKGILETMLQGNLPPAFSNTHLLRNMTFFSTALLGVMEGAITHVIGKTLLKRFRIEIPKSRPIIYYFPRKWTGYVALLGMVLYGYYNAKPFGSEIMQMSIQAIGFASMIYLIGFGVIAISVLMAARPTKPNPFFMWLLILLMIFVLGIVTVMLGFLYITTNWHEKVLNVGEKKDV